MKNYSTEILSKRIDKLEEKLQRYTEVQADTYTQITELAETLEENRKSIKGLEENQRRYTKAQADIYTQVTEITETLETISKTVREIRQELQTIKKQFGNTCTTTEPRH